jgi:enoyl-CoA hydratase
MSYETILYDDLGHVARIWLNRPEVRNAQNVQLLDELDHALERAENDDNVRVVILAAKGPSFSAGHDLKEGQSSGRGLMAAEKRWKHEKKRYYDYCFRIWDMPKATIAQVQGHCVAAGFFLANMFDLIVASEDALFGDPVVHRLGAAGGEILVHPWVLGHRVAKEILFTGEYITAEQGYARGMINRVVPLDDLEAETLKLAERIALAPPFAVQTAKRSVNQSLDIQGFRNSIEAHMNTHQLTHYSDEWREIAERGLATAIKHGRPEKEVAEKA